MKPATNLGGKAKPGPAPTPDDKLAETLQASIDAAKAKKAGAVRGKEITAHRIMAQGNEGIPHLPRAFAPNKDSHRFATIVATDRRRVKRLLIEKPIVGDSQ